MKEIFWASNMLIALDYMLIGWFFLARVRVAARVARRNPRALMALAAMTVFFFGCAHTHLDLVFLGVDNADDEHWYHPLNVASHVAQALGGLMFWWMARKHLVINIFDRVTYERVSGDVGDNEARLQNLAMRAGLIR